MLAKFMIIKFEKYKIAMKRGKRKYEKVLRKATGRRKERGKYY